MNFTLVQMDNPRNWYWYIRTGGVTTLVDMPLNNFPSTVSEETLKLKV